MYYYKFHEFEIQSIGSVRNLAFELVFNYFYLHLNK